MTTLEQLYKDRAKKIDKLNHFKEFWSKTEKERKSKQIVVKNKFDITKDENGKIKLIDKNTPEETTKIGENLIADMFYNMGYQIAIGCLRDEVEKVNRKINKIMKEERRAKREAKEAFKNSQPVLFKM